MGGIRQLPKNPSVLEVEFPTLVQSPSEVIPNVTEFRGRQRLPYAERMASVIRADLDRQRASRIRDQSRCYGMSRKPELVLETPLPMMLLL